MNEIVFSLNDIVYEDKDKCTKRIHLFEFEDFPWFPNWLRACLTRMMMEMHRLLNTGEEMASLVDRALKYTDNNTIIDLCSGNGDEIRYLTDPVDAENIDSNQKGLRTMVGCLQHMKSEAARQILNNAMKSKQPICTFGISDNSFPIAIWWIAIPINLISSLIISLLARPMTIQQIFFTSFIPIIPITFALDGAISNARTYTLDDMNILLEGLESEDYTWEKGLIKGKSKKLCLLGLPKK